MPRVSVSSKGKSRHDPLHVQLGEDETFSKFGRVSSSGKRDKKQKQEDENELDVSNLMFIARMNSHCSYLGGVRRKDVSQDLRPCQRPTRGAGSSGRG